MAHGAEEEEVDARRVLGAIEWRVLVTNLVRYLTRPNESKATATTTARMTEGHMAIHAYVPKKGVPCCWLVASRMSVLGAIEEEITEQEQTRRSFLFCQKHHNCAAVCVRGERQAPDRASLW